MKRFRNLEIFCASETEAQALLDKIVSSCNGTEFRYSQRNEISPYPVEWISAKIKGVPNATLIIGKMWSDPSRLTVCNIIPSSQSVFSLSKEEYNQILQRFYDVIVSLLTHNVSFSNEDYTIESVIPESSKCLTRWFALSHGSFSHTTDTEIWYAFVLSVLENNEELGLDDLENWLLEDKKVKPELVEKIICRYEHDYDAMEFAIKHRR